MSLPLGTSAPITSDATDGDIVTVKAPNIGSNDYNLNAGTTYVQQTTQTTGTMPLSADLSNATAATIADLRLAFASQQYAEARMNWGENYVDYLRYIGVKPSDARLQRPEFLGGGRQGLSFSEVLNTTGANTPGAMVGHGIGAMRSNRYQRFFEEHGWVISLLSVRPRSIYVNGIPKKFTKTTMEEYYQKELAGIGDEEVYNKELYSADTGPDDVFGYSPRYDTYRSEQSFVSAEMRNATNYDWHMGRIFSSDVALNQGFIECTPTKRCFAEQSEDSLWIMVNHNLQTRRMVSKHARYAGLV